MEPWPLAVALAVLLAAECPLLTLSLSPPPPIRPPPPPPPPPSPPPSPLPPSLSSPPSSRPPPALSSPGSPRSPPHKRAPPPPTPSSPGPPRSPPPHKRAPPPPSPSSPGPPPSPSSRSRPPYQHAPLLSPPMLFARPNSDMGRRSPPLPPPPPCGIVQRPPCIRRPSPPVGSDRPSGARGRGSSRREGKLNLGKKVGLAFVAVLIVLQVFLGSFLVYKKRQIGKVGYQRDLASASSSA